MSIHAKAAGTFEDITNVYARRGDVWQEIEDVYVKINDAWELVAHFTVVPPDPPEFGVSQLVSGVSGSRSAAGSVTSSAATAVPVNGTGPYTYVWTKVSGATLTINSPTAISTTFSGSLGNGETQTAVYKVTATDAAAAVAEATVNIALVSSYVAPPAGPTVVMGPKDAYANRLGSGDISIGFSASITGGTPPYALRAYTPDGVIEGASSYTVTRFVAQGTEFSSSIGFEAIDANGVGASDGTGFTLRALTP
jgi:hypothetical protein